MLLRLNKYLAQLGIASRRGVDDLIEHKKVFINGNLAQLGDKVDDLKDTVTVGKDVYKPMSDGDKQQLEYWAVYKPVGYVSSTADPSGKPVVTKLVKSKQRLYPVGRLDIDSEGLIILTNDGALTQRLTHPKHHVPKTYHVTVRDRYTYNALEKIRGGLRMKSQRIAPADVRVLEKTEEGTVLEIVLRQGMNRQIRRMMKAINLEVVKLVRVAVGGLELGDLRPGRAKQLTYEQKQLLFMPLIAKEESTLSPAQD